MKTAILALGAALTLAACGTMGGDATTTTGTGAGQMGGNLIRMYVDQQCRTELNSRNEWRVIALAMSQAQQTEWENRICGCASEEAPKQLTAADMTQIWTEEGRSRVVADVTVKTVTACVQRLYRPAS